ncbi:hypothetical protein CFIMG_008196RA00001 [Ceratocystis fimbriata CBS 114723]|uniref:Uncharacterized protein n=1 Tax=Ceratocystis fimbriata CBS 114723 TaxID=1035309 RepID=A0A2C5X645_9PEZI|nr:hypothetical protein CFIMG_008196RA00001 [Ceratocystis fimbriata CBS 114723]
MFPHHTQCFQYPQCSAVHAPGAPGAPNAPARSHKLPSQASYPPSPWLDFVTNLLTLGQGTKKQGQDAQERSAEWKMQLAHMTERTPYHPLHMLLTLY